MYVIISIYNIIVVVALVGFNIYFFDRVGKFLLNFRISFLYFYDI